MKVKLNWDGFGIAASLICAIHCALLPVLLPALSLFGVNIIHNRVFEWFMIVVAIGIGYYSLLHGYVRHHRLPGPLCFFSIGALLLVMKQFSVSYEKLLLCFAVPLIIGAHYYNYKNCKKTKCRSPHHSH